MHNFVQKPVTRIRSFRFVIVVFALLVVSPLRGQTPEEIDQYTIEINEYLDKAQQTGSEADRKALGGKALRLAREVRFDGGIVRACLFLGDISAREGRTEEALSYYLEAEERLGNTVNRTTLAGVYRAIGDLFYREKIYNNAHRYYGEVLKILPEDYETMEKAADAALLDHQYDNAEGYYKELIAQYQAADNMTRVIQLCQKLASAYEENKDPGKSLFYYLRIENILERIGYPPEKAVLYNNLGKQYARLGDYQRALNYFQKAELQCIYIDCDYQDILYANLGIALHNTGKSDQGILYLKKASLILTDRGDKASLANLQHLIATVFLANRDEYNALNHNNIAMRLAEETKQREVLMNAYKTEADIYLDLYDFEKALEFYKKYLKLLENTREEEQKRLERLNQQRTTLAAAEGQIKYLLAQQSYKDLLVQQLNYDNDALRRDNEKKEAERREAETQALLLLKEKEVNEVKLREQELLALRLRQDQRLQAQKSENERLEHLNITLQQSEAIERAERMARAQEVELLQRDKNIADLQLRQQASFKKSAYALGGLLFVILALLGVGWLFARRSNQRLAAQNRRIQAQNEQIAEERHKSDRLLLNILPEEIAQELKIRGYATPRYYDAATVVFTDFTNFTKLSALLSPEQLIDELNECFLAFDEISDKYGLEKIKTIGDAYMCAGGLPVPNKTHAYDAVCAALEMFQWLKNRKAHKPDAVFFEMRIGIHTGPVVAGVVGKNKFAYDIWGDAVNLASRLEELGEAGRVNISGATYETIKDRFTCTYRGKQPVHNKGLVDMYFIENIIT